MAKKKENELSKTFKTWLKTKWQVFGTVMLIIGIVWAIVLLVQIPYKIYQIAGLGDWGVIIGTIILFFAANIPAGILALIFRIDDEDIMRNVEIGIMVITIIVMGVTYVTIHNFPAGLGGLS